MREKFFVCRFKEETVETFERLTFTAYDEDVIAMCATRTARFLNFYSVSDMIMNSVVVILFLVSLSTAFISNAVDSTTGSHVTKSLKFVAVVSIIS